MFIYKPKKLKLTFLHLPKTWKDMISLDFSWKDTQQYHTTISTHLGNIRQEKNAGVRLLRPGRATMSCIRGSVAGSCVNEDR